MLWECAVAGTSGLLLGTRYRVPALVAATAILLVGIMIVSGLTGSSLKQSVLSVALVAMLQGGGYVLGLLLAFAWSLARPRRPIIVSTSRTAGRQPLAPGRAQRRAA
jgi:hypothetical protein